ncbi:MAG: asparagine synthase (glutamine-hydrolyzing), partial [Gemmataceae bacterium]|nr:asparagine synthase (glutamine-hydrolyzing) [Gemmataceae bacterium]
MGIESPIAGPAAARMLSALRHRGPDDTGREWVPAANGGLPPVALAHARLAILDPTPAGHQPMSGGPAGARTWVTFNGEIYNFHELAGELAARGHPAHTLTDTEVLLNAYQVWGEAAVEKLRGMFAFALADPAAGRVWFARDRLGIKPLYLYRPAGGGLLFASEVRALLAAGPNLVPRRLDRRAVESFLSQGAVYGPEAHVEGVRALDPGETLTTDWSGNPVGRRRYWAIPFAPAGAPTPHRAGAVSELGRVAREALRLHLIADVPLGVFLSAGVDSTSVATLATESAPGGVRTVSVGFDRPEFDETEPAAAFARELGTDHQTVRLTAADIRTDLESVLAATDQPTVDGF